MKVNVAWGSPVPFKVLQERHLGFRVVQIVGQYSRTSDIPIAVLGVIDIANATATVCSGKAFT